MKILFDPSDMPPTGRVLRAGSESLEACHGMQTLISLKAACKLHSQQQKQRRPGEDLYWTSSLTTELPIRVAESGPGSLPPMTVVDYFADTVRRYPERPALAFEPACGSQGRGGSRSSSSSKKEKKLSSSQLPASCFLTREGPPPRAGGEEGGGGAAAAASASNPLSCVAGPMPGWCMYTWQGYWNDVCMCAKALLFVGSSRRTRVALMGVNSPGWCIPYFASIFIDGVAVGVYATNTVEATYHVISHAGCRVAFVDTLANAEKMLSVRRMQQQAFEKDAAAAAHQQQQQGEQQARLGRESSRVHAARRKRSGGGRGRAAGGAAAAAGGGAAAAAGGGGGAQAADWTSTRNNSSSRGRGRVSSASSSSSRGSSKSQRGSRTDVLGGSSSSTGAAEAAGHLVEEAGLDTAAEDGDNGRQQQQLPGSRGASSRAAAAQRSMPFAPATFPPFQGVQTQSGSYYGSAAAAEVPAAAGGEEDEGACQVLQLIVVYAEEVPDDMHAQGVMNFDEFLLLGEQVEDVLLTERMEAQRAGQCCSIVYTSGTTGFPKGVMLSHDNLTWTAICSTQMMKIDNSHCLVSFLPLSHVAAQLVDLLMPIHMGCCIFFAQPDALQGSLLHTLQAVRPTWFLGVPRVWEKIEQRLKAMAQARLAQIRGTAAAAAPSPPAVARNSATAAAGVSAGDAAAENAKKRSAAGAAAAAAAEAMPNGGDTSSSSSAAAAAGAATAAAGGKRRRSRSSSAPQRKMSTPSADSAAAAAAAAGGGEAAAASQMRSASFSSAAATRREQPATSAGLTPGGGGGGGGAAAAAGGAGSSRSYLSRLSISLSVASLKHSLVEWAKDVGYRGSTALLDGRTSDIPAAFPLVMRLLLQPVRRALGLDRCLGLGSCAAPLAESTQKYFLSLGMPINSIYGLSETTGPQTFLLPAPGWFKVGSIGHAMPSTDVLVASEDSAGQGELCFRGRNVFMGYYKDAKSTQEVLDRHAFLHTGDLGMVDEDGFVFITGRIKELLITAGGENVAPLLLESNLMQELPSLLSNCMVVGDRRRFLAVLVCLHTARGNWSAAVSTQQLSPEVLDVIRPLGSTSRTLQDAQQDPIINALIKAAIERANQRTISRAQIIQGWRVLPSEFSVETGELTATMKLRRKFVEAKFADLIEEMYENPVPPCLLRSATETAEEEDPNSCAVDESPPQIQSKL